jgi:hypothetical protein
MSETEEPAGAKPAAGEPAGQKIDLQALAERIYRLLKEEARLERERLGRFQAQ